MVDVKKKKIFNKKKPLVMIKGAEKDLSEFTAKLLHLHHSG